MQQVNPYFKLSLQSLNLRLEYEFLRMINFNKFWRYFGLAKEHKAIKLEDTGQGYFDKSFVSSVSKDEWVILDSFGVLTKIV